MSTWFGWRLAVLFIRSNFVYAYTYSIIFDQIFLVGDICSFSTRPVDQCGLMDLCLENQTSYTFVTEEHSSPTRCTLKKKIDLGNCYNRKGVEEVGRALHVKAKQEVMVQMTCLKKLEDFQTSCGENVPFPVSPQHKWRGEVCRLWNALTFTRHCSVHDQLFYIQAFY